VTGLPAVTRSGGALARGGVGAACETPSIPEDEGVRGAACRNRTDDLFITSESLYRLS
jgi:hypothetical protein